MTPFQGARLLTCLRVRDFAIIEQVEIELGPGLSVVTGETGAGKSILVDALDLVLGGRASRDLVRTGAERADLEALFEDGDRQRVLRRSVLAGGRTRAYVDGALATVAELAGLAEGLVDISSQHEHHTLVDPATHLGFLDAYAGLDAERDAVGAAHAALLQAAGAVSEARARVVTRVEREDLLRYQLGEIERLGLQAGEVAELEAERERLRHAETLMGAARRAEIALYAKDGSVVQQLDRVTGELQAAARHDPRLSPWVEVLGGAMADLEDVARDLGTYARDVDADPVRLEQVEERLFEALRLVRKYGGTEEALLVRAVEARAELDVLEGTEARIEALERARAAASARAATVARRLSEARKAAAGTLARAITAELSSLGMGGARVEVEVSPLSGGASELEVDGARLTSSGLDRAEFLISPNPGEEPRPLRKVASGGELSRSLLAIKRVLAERGPVGLYVFDEVDAGVGGAVAEVIGQKLAEVARHHQVLCITHLPQIAVYADAHYQVTKRVEGGRTVSEVRRLSEQARLEELSRMLGGIEVKDVHRAAAAAMLQAARS